MLELIKTKLANRKKFKFSKEEQEYFQEFERIIMLPMESQQVQNLIAEARLEIIKEKKTLY